MKRILFVTSFTALSLALWACTDNEVPPANGALAPSSQPTAVVVPTATVPQTTLAPPADTTVRPDDDAGADADADSGPETKSSSSSSSGGAVIVTTPHPVTWQPNYLNGLALWLRSDLGVTKDNLGNVETWKDQSTQHNDATAVVTGKPVDGGGTNHGLKFSGAQALVVPDAVSLQLGPSDDFDVVVIAASSQTTGTYGALFGKTSGTTPFAGPGLFVNHPSEASGTTGHVGGQLDIGNVALSTSGNLDDGKTRMYLFGRAGNSISVGVNEDVGASHVLVNPSSPSAIGENAYIGGHPENGLNQGFVGVIYEVIVTKQPIDDSTRSYLYSYANARYGLE